ncbi:MAG: phosphoribosylanthranilate isomerase [Candidatus Bathyarchaeota archaeon]|nr:phosphoribosylanthranilate isomerase [Candidatus Bathyarchaeota archaeon]
MTLLSRYGKTRVKICCIASVDEAMLAIRCGASALGLVADMPSGPGVIPEELISEIASTVPPYVTSVLLTSQKTASAIVKQHQRCGTNAIQIVDRLESGNYGELREFLPGIDIIQVIHVVGEESIDETIKIAPQVDAILLDSGNPNLEIKELGGTGRIHDWNLSKRIKDSIDKPLILAGGLNPENVVDAIRRVEPYAVDVCSGVRKNGILDEAKLSLFMNRVAKL